MKKHPLQIKNRPYSKGVVYASPRNGNGLHKVMIECFHFQKNADIEVYVVANTYMLNTTVRR